MTRAVFDCLPTLAESIIAISGQVTTTNASSVDVNSNRNDGIVAAFELATEADVIILCLGITKGTRKGGRGSK
jgi:hypothetical protein